MVAEVVLVPRISMVAVRMGNNSIVHRFPGINEEFAGRAKQAFICKFYQHV
jgi:hypothetical protein